ncbi:MAG: P-loop NTPase fold protein [Alphaproteobacteria bacterium]|nr:P-loop NTPase fold protein [Alphaproteobacteria bacterium]
MQQKIVRRPKLIGDSAKASCGEDVFGVSKLAKDIAETIRERADAEGYSIGIEGEWGSGKTTVLNFIEKELGCSDKEGEKRNSSVVIRFNPWLVGKRDKLLKEFFGQLLRKVRDIPFVYKKKRGIRGCEYFQRVAHENLLGWFGLSSRIRRYSQALDSATASSKKVISSFPAVVQFIIWFLYLIGASSSVYVLFDQELLSISYLMLSIIVVLLIILSGVMSLIAWSVSGGAELEEAKERIEKGLRKLKARQPTTRIIVLIDDTDRLEPDEAVEILRLVKAVANLPLVVFVVCFDRKILSQQIQKSLGAENGGRYLEKIFQYTHHVPPREVFALRRFVIESFQKDFPEEMSGVEDESAEKGFRKTILINRWIGPFIKTPRDAIRLCEAIRFGWPYIRGNADFIDFVWLQLIKLQTPELYEWIESYVSTIGSERDGGRPDEGDVEVQREKLQNALEAIRCIYPVKRIHLSEFIIGLKGALNDSEHTDLFGYERDDLKKFEEGKRLCSPSHWREYFAFEKPSYALDDDEIVKFRSLLLSDPEAAQELLLKLSNKPHEILGHYLDVFLDRLSFHKNSLRIEEQKALLLVFSEMMDKVPRKKDSLFDGADVRRVALRLLGKESSISFLERVQNGASINWLAYVIRDQGFILGKIKEGPAYPELEWLTVDQLTGAAEQAIIRFRTLGIEGILKQPDPLTIIFCWRQLGDPEELKRLVEKAAEDDGIFINFLEALQSSGVSSNRGAYKFLNKSYVGYFMDCAAAVARLEKMKGDNDPKVEPTIPSRAATLLDRLEDKY